MSRSQQHQKVIIAVLVCWQLHTFQDSVDNSSIDKVETSLEWQEYFSQFRDITDALPCHIHLPVCLLIMDPHNRAPKKNRSHGNKVLLQNTTNLIQRPCYHWGCPCQHPAGNWTTQRPPDHRKEMQTAVVWSCLPFIRSGQNHLARQSERGKKTRQTEEEMGRQHQGMDRPGLPSPRGQRRTAKNGGNWLWNHLRCPNDPRSEGIDDDDDDDDELVVPSHLQLQHSDSAGGPSLSLLAK